MTRLVILVILTGCILTIVTMTTNWSSSLTPQIKPKEVDWPPLVFVQEMPETRVEKERSKRKRSDVPDWLQALAELASSRSGESQEVLDTQPQIALGKLEPIYHTVYVPIFVNDTPHRGPEIDLTRKVIAGIEARTPFKIAFARERANSEIQGRLYVQEIQIKTDQSKKKTPVPGLFMLEVKWLDLRGGKILVEKRLAAVDLRSIRKGHFALLDDWTLGEMAKKVVDVIVKEGGKKNWLQQ
jgi:hypothetical protein